MKRVASALVGSALLIGLGGCGGGSAIDAKGSELLQAEVAAARSAAARGDRTQAADLLQTVENTVEALRRQDKVSQSRASEILAAVGTARTALQIDAAAQSTTTVPVQVTQPTAPNTIPAQAGDEQDNDDHRGRNKRGKGGRDD